MVHKPTLIHKIYNLGIRGPMAYYLRNFLSGNRRMRVRCRSIFSDFKEMENGLPQGSCISPLLFNVFIDDLFANIPQQVHFSLFADDSALWCTDADCDVSVNYLQNSLVKLENWSRHNGLRFSAEKSAAVVFSRQTNTSPSVTLRIYNNVIPFQSHFKFLGVVLDRNLSMGKHVQHIKTKCSSRLNLFRCMTSSDCSADRATLLKLYKAIVRPVIEYGAAVYSGGKTKTLDRLEPIQNSFLRVALGAMRTSPISALQVEANIPPLSIRRKELSLRFYAKIQQFPDHVAYTAIHTLPRLHHNYVGPCERRTGLTMASRVKMYCDELQVESPVTNPHPKLDTVPWKLHPRKVTFLIHRKKSETLEAEVQQEFLLFKMKHENFTFIYTDGSKIQNRTGNAIFAEELGDRKCRLPDCTSVYMAELHAIYLALKLIKRHHIRQACICSDSKSALQCIVAPSFQEHLHFQIINIHQKLIDEGTTILFLWLPGHSGVPGNERADKNAKRALHMPNITNIPVNHLAIRPALRHSTTRFWNRKWQNDSTKTHLHDIKAGVGTWSSSSRRNRLEEKLLARLRLGHTSLTHSYIFQQTERPECPTCHTHITVKHILLHCQDFNRSREPLKAFCRTHNLLFNLHTLLGDEYPELLQLIFDFLKHINIYSKL